MIDARDRILQAHTPVVIVPLYGALEPMTKPGHRYLVADDGLWLEVKRDWLHAIVPTDSALPEELGRHRLPFGPMEGKVEYAFGAPQVDGLRVLFLYDARAALPNEAAAWGVWNTRTRTLEYRRLHADESSPGGIRFQRPALEDHEELAVDLHSHGATEAFFSLTDDEDDRGEVKISYVVGELAAVVDPQWAARLCLLGLFIGGKE